MQPQLDFAQLQELFRDPIQQRYELIRPLVLFQDRTATERAEETGTHPETVSRLTRRFEQQGLLGLLPDSIEVVPAGRRRRVPDTVVQELTRLKGQPFQGSYSIRFSWSGFSQWRRGPRFCMPFVPLVSSWDRADVSCSVAG